MPLTMTLRLVLLLVLLSGSIASAQTTAQAEKLFKDGKTLMAEGKYPEACSAFEASQKLDANINTLVNLANCREKNQQIATAWGLFLEVEKQTRDDAAQKAMNKTAKTRAVALEARSSYLIINVPDDSRVDGLTITLDGKEVDPVTWNSTLPIDGGAYEVSGKAPGHEAWSTKVTVANETDKQSVDVPRFKSIPTVDPAKQPGEPGGDLVVAPQVDGPAPTGMTGKRKLALVLGPVGVVALGFAVGFELAAEGNYDDAAGEANNDLQRELTDNANQQRSYAIALGVVGVASVGVATYLWFTGGRAARDGRAAVVPTVRGDGLGLAFVGSF